jgi:hypothetical protein
LARVINSLILSHHDIKIGKKENLDEKVKKVGSLMTKTLYSARMLHVRTKGGLTIFCQGKSIVFFYPKGQSITAKETLFLVARERRHKNDQVAFSFGVA